MRIIYSTIMVFSMTLLLTNCNSKNIKEAPLTKESLIKQIDNIPKYQAMDLEALGVLYSNEDIPKAEKSFITYHYGMRHIQGCVKKKDAKLCKKGHKLLHEAADQRYNPFAMVRLAKFYFHENLEKSFGVSETGFKKDLSKSHYYINMAFTITGLIKENLKEKTVLNGVIGMGLALIDTFHQKNLRGEFDTSANGKKFKNKMDKNVAAFLKTYSLKNLKIK